MPTSRLLRKRVKQRNNRANKTGSIEIFDMIDLNKNIKGIE